MVLRDEKQLNAITIRPTIHSTDVVDVGGYLILQTTTVQASAEMDDVL